MLQEIIGIEQVGHDLRGAGLPAPDELLGVQVHAVLEAFAGLRRRQKTLVGPTRAHQRGAHRLGIRFVDVHDRAIGDLGLLRPSGLLPFR